MAGFLVVDFQEWENFTSFGLFWNVWNWSNCTQSASRLNTRSNCVVWIQQRSQLFDWKIVSCSVKKFSENDWVCKRCICLNLGLYLLFFELGTFNTLVPCLMLNQFASFGQAHDVAVGFDTKHTVVILVVLQSSLPDSNALTLFKPLELLVQDLSVPYLVGVVNHSHFWCEVIQFEKLKNFYAQIKIKVFVIILNNAEMTQVGDELVTENGVLVKDSIGPFPKRSKDFHLTVFKRKLFTKKHERSEFNISFFFWLVCWCRSKNSPWTIEENVGRKLLVTFELRYTSSMDPNDVSYSLWNWQIFKLICEEDQSTEIYGAIHSVDRAALISYLQGKDVLLRLKALVRELGIKNNSVEMQFGLTNGAFS